MCPNEWESHGGLRYSNVRSSESPLSGQGSRGSHPLSGKECQQRLEQKSHLLLTHWSLCYLSSGKGNVCWAELSPTSITHISCLGDTINQYTSKQHITGLTNTGTKMRKAGTPVAPMSACFIDRVGRLQVIVIHCSVHASQGGKDLWHKDPLKKYALCNISAHRERHDCLYSHPGKDLIVSSRVSEWLRSD